MEAATCGVGPGGQHRSFRMVRLRRDPQTWGVRPRLAWHLWKKYMCRDLGCVSHVAVNVSQPCCVSSQHGCCALFIYLFIYFNIWFLLRRNFNISSIKAKRAVNRMHCLVPVVIGGPPPQKKPQLGVQSHANSISLIPVWSAVSGSVISVPKGGKIKNPFTHQTNPLKR